LPFFQTGIDPGTTGIKKVSSFVLPFFQYYKITGEKERGRLIFLVPSHKVLFKKLPKEVKDEKEAKRFLHEEILGYIKTKVFWKIWWEKEEGKVIIAEIDKELKKNAIWDVEPFALARILLAEGIETGDIVDLGNSKITWIKIKNRKIERFRVFMDYEEFFEEAKGISFEKKILLSGGKSRDRELVKKFEETLGKKVRITKLISPEKASAFGASLLGVLGKSLPVFSEETSYSPETYIKLSFVLGICLIFTGTAILTLDTFSSQVLKKIKLEEKKLFKSAFPGIRPVAPLKQLKVMLNTKKTGFYKIFADFLKQIPERVKIIEIDYEAGVLRAKLEVSQREKPEFPGKVISVKNLPGGTEIVEIEFKGS
jgi:hypothetical protein